MLSIHIFRIDKLFFAMKNKLSTQQYEKAKQTKKIIEELDTGETIFKITYAIYTKQRERDLKNDIEKKNKKFI